MPTTNQTRPATNRTMNHARPPHNDELPVFMCGIRDTDVPASTALQLSSRLVPEGDGEVLYYPGCGSDYGPLVHFAQTTKLKAVVYVDYLLKVADIKAMLHTACRGLHIPVPERFSVLRPRQLGVADWSHFWHESPRSKQFFGPTHGTGFQCQLELPSGTASFVFLRTEGHQTYANLLNTPLQPSIVVLQDHGFGCNWTNFGDESPMFEAAERQRSLPRKLFVAEGTRPWPGYHQTGDYDYQRGQMHNFARAVFERYRGGAERHGPIFTGRANELV